MLGKAARTSPRLAALTGESRRDSRPASLPRPWKAASFRVSLFCHLARDVLSAAHHPRHSRAELQRHGAQREGPGAPAALTGRKWEALGSPAWAPPVPGAHDCPCRAPALSRLPTPRAAQVTFGRLGTPS